MINTQYRKPLPGTQLDYFDAREAVNAIAPAPGTGSPTPPASTPRTWFANAIRPSSTSASGQIVSASAIATFPWFPARVVCHDILGQTALVDLAGLRDAIAEQGAIPPR